MAAAQTAASQRFDVYKINVVITPSVSA